MKIHINPKTTLLIFAVMLLVFSGQGIVYAHNIPEAHYDDDSTTRSVAENSARNTNIGSPVTATSLPAVGNYRYTLKGTDAASFSIVSGTGQLKTKAALDYETKSSYTVTVAIEQKIIIDAITNAFRWDEKDSITVTITVTDVAWGFATDSVTRTIAENSSSGTNIGDEIVADTNGFYRYRLGGTDAASFQLAEPLLDGRIIKAQLKVKNSLNFESKNSYSVTIDLDSAIEEQVGSPPSLQIVGYNQQDSITVTINVTNINEAPTFPASTDTTLEIAENTAANQPIGTAAIAATDQDLTTANTDSNPNTDADDDLIYILQDHETEGSDASAFTINHTSGHLTTKDPLDYEKQKSYSVTVEVADGVLNSDGRLTDTIDITINIENVNEAPTFDSATTTREVSENLEPITNIGDPVAATGFDLAKFDRYILEGEDAESFTLDSETGQLTTTATLDHEDESSYEVIVTVQRGIEQTGGEIEYPDDVDQNSTTVTINVKNISTIFIDENGDKIDEATRSIPENTDANVTIYPSFTVQDPVGTTYALSAVGGTNDWAAFNITSIDSGVQLKTRNALNYETQNTYKFRLLATISDGENDHQLTVTVNIEDVNEFAPVFTEGDSASRDIVENAPAGTEIGRPVVATDDDTADIITYTLGGTDAASFDIDSETGQLLTKYPLDYEAVKNVYEVTVTASDGEFSDSISVTINVTDLVSTFIEDDPTTRSIAENTARGTNIGDPVSATGPDIGYTLTYSLGGTDDAPDDYKSFDIDSTNGQLITKAALNYEVKFSYEVMVTVSDGNHPADTITVIITVTDQTEGPLITPMFPAGTPTTYSIPENTPAGVDIGFPVAAINLLASFDYSLTGSDRTIFTLDTQTGQLRTSAPLDYETKNSYSVNVNLGYTPADMKLYVSHSITIEVENVNEAPMFADERTVRSIPENAAAGTNIGAAVTATDPDLTSSNTDANPGKPDVDDALTYTLDGTDAASFNINSTTGQLTTKTGVTFNAATKDRYDVTVTVDDSESDDTIDVIININAMPTVLIDVPTEVQNGAFDVMITFSEAVDGFTAADITLTLSLTTGTGTPSTTLQSGSDGDMSYTVGITPPAEAEGEVAIEVAAGAATSTANTTTTAASDTHTVNIDTLRPTSTIIPN